MKTTVLLLFVAVLSFGQSATPIAYPNRDFSVYLTQEAQSVPTTPTVITTRNLIFGGGWISCTSARAITLTDGNSVSPFPAVSLSVNTFYSLSGLAGAYLSGGFSISADGSGCKYSAWWRQ